MALSNEIRLICHCGGAPKKIKNFVKVAVYTRHYFKNQAGAFQEQQECHFCLFFGKNAIKAERFLQKGTQVHLSGTLHYEKRTRPNGESACYSQVIVEEFTVAEKIAVSKEMYHSLFPNEEGNRLMVGLTHHEIEEFDKTAHAVGS